jgi:hypothetical protein
VSVCKEWLPGFWCVRSTINTVEGVAVGVVINLI